MAFLHTIAEYIENSHASDADVIEGFFQTFESLSFVMISILVILLFAPLPCCCSSRCLVLHNYRLIQVFWIRVCESQFGTVTRERALLKFLEGRSNSPSTTDPSEFEWFGSLNATAMLP